MCQLYLTAEKNGFNSLVKNTYVIIPITSYKAAVMSGCPIFSDIKIETGEIAEIIGYPLFH